MAPPSFWAVFPLINPPGLKVMFAEGVAKMEQICRCTLRVYRVGIIEDKALHGKATLRHNSPHRPPVLFASSLLEAHRVRLHGEGDALSSLY